MRRRNGTHGNDAILLTDQLDGYTVLAGGGDDWVDASNFADTIFGNGGNDAIAGGVGDDQVNGGIGDDAVFGEAGDDIVFGGAGNDGLLGGRGDDHLDGGAGNDALAGEDGNDRLGGGLGGDLLSGGAGNDVLLGDEFDSPYVGGNDSLEGGDGQDHLAGHGGNDVLFGGRDADTLEGGWGRDVLDGGQDRDTLTGGLGADVFAFGADGISTRTQRIGSVTIAYETYETDTIVDFANGHRDIIDLSRLLAAKTDFTGATAYDAIAQGYLYFIQHGMEGYADFGTMVYVDRNGQRADLIGESDLAVVDILGVPADTLLGRHFLV